MPETSTAGRNTWSDVIRAQEAMSVLELGNTRNV